MLSMEGAAVFLETEGTIDCEKSPITAGVSEAARWTLSHAKQWAELGANQ
jgi:hypothetical protein